MSEQAATVTASLPAVPATAVDEAPPGRLEGRMGTVELVFTVLAFSAPLAVVSGFIPFVIIFGGRGAPAAYLAAGIVLALFAVGLSTMSRFVPNPGAFYAYVTSGLGRVAGLGAAFLAVYGYWMLAVATYAFFGLSANTLVHDTFSGPEIAWYWYALALVIVCGVLGYLNVEISAKVLAVAMTLEVALVLIFDVAVAADGGANGLSLAPLGWNAFTSGTVGVAVLFAALCFLGFESTAIFREEAKDPAKTVPRAMFLAVVLIGLFYVAAALMMVLAYGQEGAVKVANDNPPGMFAGAVGQYLDHTFVDLVSVLLLSSIFAALVAVQNMMSRYLYSMGVDGTLPRSLGSAHPRFRSPHRASVVISITLFAGLLPFVVAGSDPALLYGRLAGVGGFAITLLMLLASVAVIVFFARSPSRREASLWQTTIAPGLSVIGLGIIVFLAIDHFSTVTGTTGTLATCLVLLTFATLVAGAALAVLYRARKPDVYRSIGRQHL
jgi:amino acid transporter